MHANEAAVPPTAIAGLDANITLLTNSVGLNVWAPMQTERLFYSWIKLLVPSRR
jgi:hypothetical protein